MLEEYQKFKILDKNGKNDFYVEVNWRPDDPNINQCKVLKFIFPGKKGEKPREAYVDKKMLLSLLWIIGSRSEQRKMIPQKITVVRHYRTNLYIRVNQDLKAGDILKVPVCISLPAVSEEIIGEIERRENLRKALKRDIEKTPKLYVPTELEKRSILHQPKLEDKKENGKE